MNYWLVKQEPSKYSWEQFVQDKETYWDGVRNYQARNNLKEMKKNDKVLFYHSVVGKEVMGIARVTKEAYPDPTTDDDRWVVVDLKPIVTMKQTVTLEDIKSHPELQSIALVKQSRLSVSPLTEKEFKIIMDMGNTKIKGV
jgi:predicted RNA-binding protein with PUA-like domain